MAKLKRLQWHKLMKSRALLYAEGKCQNCHKSTTIDSGVIHHINYPAGVYERDVEELMDNGICVWLCNECHNEIHIAHSFEESKQHLKSGGYCKLCNKLVFDGWARARTLDLNYCICKDCYRSMKRYREAKKQ